MRFIGWIVSGIFLTILFHNLHITWNQTSIYNILMAVPGTVCDMVTVYNLCASTGYCLTSGNFTVCVLALSSIQHSHWYSLCLGAASYWTSCHCTNCASSTRHYLTSHHYLQLGCQYLVLFDTWSLQFLCWYWSLFRICMLVLRTIWHPSLFTVCVSVPDIIWHLATTCNLYANAF